MAKVEKMKLNDPVRQKLIRISTQVYQGYLALDFFKHKSLTFNPDSPCSLFEFSRPDVAYLLQNRDKTIRYPIVLGDKTYDFCLHKIQAQGYSTRIECILRRPLNVTNPLQLPSDYDENDTAVLLSNRSFMIDVLHNGQWAVSLNLGADHQLGGIGKLDLYRTHLVTLFNIIKNLQSDVDNRHLLVALATGSGKTYVQALWMYILHLGGFTGIFAVPETLMAQFYKDLQRFLPDKLLQETVIFGDQSTQDIRAVLHHPGKTILTSNHFLLDEHYLDVVSASSQQTFLSFDEQHLVMLNERRRMRLLQLSNKYLSIFLTATPSRMTYELSGSQPVALMSSGQKEKAGQGQFPTLITTRCEFISDLHRKQTFAFATVAYARKWLNGLFLGLNDAFQPESSSAAKAVLQELPYLLQRKPNETALRWSLQVPMARKMLCVIDDNESLVNFCDFLQTNHTKVYHKGNFIERHSIADFFGVVDADAEVFTAEKRKKDRRYLEGLSSEEIAILGPLQSDIAYQGLRYQLKSNMFHYMVEYVLSDLTSRDMIEHNRLRKNSLPAFIALVKNHYLRKTPRYYQEKLTKDIDPAGAQKIGELLGFISSYLHEVLRCFRPDDQCLFIDNWFLERTHFRKICLLMPSFAEAFDEYADKHLVMGLMTGMAHAETPIADSKPFLGLNEERYLIYDSDKKKKRQRTAVELLNDGALESRFEPRYENISEHIADQYFRLGFVGIYVSNKKTEGFSDPNLHTVLNIAEHTYSANNNPTILIQSMGRNRGLDETVVPQYIHALGRGQETSFDLQSLAKDDYYPELFAAQDHYKKNYIALLGQQVGKDIVAWYHQHVDVDETIDADQLKRQVLLYVTRALRRLNAQEDHHIQVSRAQLTQVIREAMRTLDQEIAYMRRPYQLPFLVRALGTVINFVCECYDSLMRLQPALDFFRHAWLLPIPAQCSAENKADLVYMKIIQHTRFKHLVSQTLVIKEFKTAVMRQQAAIQHTIQKSLYVYATPAVKAQMDVHRQQTIMPVLEKMVVSSQVDLLRGALTQTSDFFGVLQSNHGLIDSLDSNVDSAVFIQQALGFFHKIPGLEHLRAGDIVDFPRLLKGSIAWMQQNPLEIFKHEPELQNKASLELCQFLQQECNDYLNALVTYPDATQIRAALADRDKMQRFAELIVHKTQVDSQMPSLETAFEAFKYHVDLPHIEILPTKVKHLSESFDELQQGFALDYISSRITPLVQGELLPCLVNYYPQTERQRLINEIKPEELTQLLHSQKEHIYKLTKQPDALAAFLFSNLCTRVPQQCNLDVEFKKSRAFVEEQTNGVSPFVNILLFTLGLTKARIKSLLTSEPFFDAISLILPFHHWTELKQRFRSDSQSLEHLAEGIYQALQTQQELTAEQLLYEINRVFRTSYQTTPDYGRCVAEELSNRMQPAAFKFTSAQKKRLATWIRRECLPVMAAFIRDEKKALFLSQSPSDQHLCEFFSSRLYQLQTLSQADEATTYGTAQRLIQALYPNLIRSKDMLNPMQEVARCLSLCQQALQKRMQTMFLMSDTCKQKMTVFLNTGDYQLLEERLNNRMGAENLIACFFPEHEPVNETALLDKLRSSDPALRTIRSLPERIEDLQRDIISLAGDKQSIDKEKWADLMVQQLSPIFRHAEFKASMNLFIGSLTQSDIQLIFQAKGLSRPQESAKRLLRLQQIIQREDWVGFKREFVVEVCDSDRFPFEAVLEDFAKLIEEVMDCHGYYNQHTPKGIQDTAISPALLTKMSPQLKAIRVPAFDGHFMSHFSRKIFFIQGIRNGLPRASRVSADMNKTTISVLQRIKNHILQPLWWGVNASKLFYQVVKLGQFVVSRIRDLGFAVWNTIKSIFGGQGSMKNQHSVDYHQTSVACAEAINLLTPLTADQIAQPNCPKDVITLVEQCIDQHTVRSHARLFDHAISHPVDAPALDGHILNPTA